MKQIKVKMKHLMRYEGYSTKERVDDILDKISKYGIGSITDLEKDFLDAHAQGDEEKIHKEIIKLESERVFEDDQGYFKFELGEIKYFGDETHYIGIMYVPDLEFNNGKRIEGRLVGKIVCYKDGSNSLDFNSISKKRYNYDIFEFCNGLEYELDSFIDYIIDELKNK